MRRLFRITSILAVLAFLASMILAWLAAPGPMALVTASAMIIYLLSEIRKG